MPDAPAPISASSVSTFIVSYWKEVSLSGLLALIIWSSYAGYWVWGTDYAKLEKDRDEWKALVLRANNLMQDPSNRPIGMAPPVVNDLKHSIQSKLEEAAK